MTGAIVDVDVRGRGGQSLPREWAEGTRTYLGLGGRRLPESVHDHRSRQPVGDEQHDRLDRAARGLDRRLPDVDARARHDTIEAAPEAEEAWVDHVNAVADATLFPRANSWYMGANVPGKPRVFMPYIGGVGMYRQKCDEVAALDYAGFRFLGAQAERESAPAAHAG